MTFLVLSLILDKSIAYIAKFDNGDFEMPSETLLKAIELCGSTPEEFFFRNSLLNSWINFIFHIS